MLTEEQRAHTIMSQLKHVDTVYFLLSPEDREKMLLSTLHPRETMRRTIHKHPCGCVFGSSAIAFVVGIALVVAFSPSLMSSSRRPSSGYRSAAAAQPSSSSHQPSSVSSTCKRTVERMLDYA